VWVGGESDDDDTEVEYPRPGAGPE
jgi:hypothetical protein